MSSNNFYIFSVYVDCVSLYCTEFSAKAEMTNQAAQKNYDVHTSALSLILALNFHASSWFVTVLPVNTVFKDLRIHDIKSIIISHINDLTATVNGI